VVEQARDRRSWLSGERVNRKLLRLVNLPIAGQTAAPIERMFSIAVQIEVQTRNEVIVVDSNGCGKAETARIKTRIDTCCAQAGIVSKRITFPQRNYARVDSWSDRFPENVRTWSTATR